MEADRFLVRAGVLVPVARPPIHDGAVFIEHDRIRDVGDWAALSGQHAALDVLDLSDQIVLPGFVNAHCHLDYTRMAAGIPPQKSFSDWIKAILSYKADWSYTDFAESWVAGAGMLLRSGTTTVLDVEAVPELLSEVPASTPLRVISALEMTGIRSGRTPAEVLSSTLAGIPDGIHEGARIALSPHSLYATRPELITLATAECRARGWLMTTHVAESTEEHEMFVHRRGPMFDWLGTQRDMSDCDGGSPVTRLKDLGALSDRFIAVHANCVSGDDIAMLAESGASVVHCPRSHDYFRHPRFPLEQFEQAGVNVCLGTDSLATVRGTNRPNIELNMFREMQMLAKTQPAVSAERIVRLATMHGARALGRSGEIGEMSPGALADLIAVPRAPETADVFQAVLQHTGPVTQTLVGGRVVFAEP